MVWRNLHALFLVVILVSTVEAVPPRIIFHGNHAFSHGELLGFIEPFISTDNLGDSLDYIGRNLQDSIIAHDFLFAHVDSIALQERRSERLELHIFLQEGPLATVSSVDWLGDSLLVPRSLFERQLTKLGTVFRWSSTEYDIERMLDYFENNGRPYARVDVKEITADTLAHSATLKFWIGAGPNTIVEFVSFAGAKSTQTSFLLRESRLRIGDPYDERSMEKARRYLAHLDVIRYAGKGEIVADDKGRTGVRFPMEEARSTRLDIVAGYLPKTESSSPLLTGLVNVEFLSLFGSGRKARIHWEQPDRRIQSVEVSYREPWIFGQPFALRGDFGQRIEDTLYVTRRIALRGEADLFTNVSVWGTVQREEILADSLSSILLGLPDSKTTYLESGFAFDTRDHLTNPRGGVFFSTYAGTAWRKRDQQVGDEPAGSFRQQRGGIDVEAAQEIFPFWITDIGVHARALETNEPQVLQPDLYRLGGARTLRGYREEQFLGSRIGWTSVELRYWLGPASRVFAFWDAGSVYRRQVINSVAKESSLFRMGAGIGLRLDTNVGIWGFDYGVGEGDHLLGGKLHISLLSTF